MDNSDTKTLFVPRHVAGAPQRDTVPILQCSYHVFTRAVSALLTAWLDGREGHGAPTEDWETGLIRTVNAQVNTSPKTESPSDVTDIDAVCEKLKDLKILSHFRIVTSHRYWLHTTLTFLKKIGVEFSDKMDTLIRRHDLSKYTHREALGYAVMFGDGSNAWRKLEDENEKQEWETTLKNHYAYNPHHPEYFGRHGEFGSTSGSQDIADVEETGADDFVVESIIDMLAARGERILKDDAEISVMKWMDIDERYLKRYTSGDKVLVEKSLQEWKQKVSAFFRDEENVKGLEGHFDSRRLVL